MTFSLNLTKRFFNLIKNIFNRKYRNSRKDIYIYNVELERSRMTARFLKEIRIHKIEYDS